MTATKVSNKLISFNYTSNLFPTRKEATFKKVIKFAIIFFSLGTIFLFTIAFDIIHSISKLHVYEATNTKAFNTYDAYVKGKFVLRSYNYSPFELSQLKVKSFRIRKNNVYYGEVERLNNWTRTYTLKINDQVQAICKANLFSYGSLFDFLKSYEVKDNNNNVIGYIRGVFKTKNRAEFLFYNEKQELFAKSILHHENPQLTIHSPDGKLLIRGIRKLVKFDDSNPYFHFSFLSIPSYHYSWEIIEEDTVSFNPKFLWPFIGFIGEVWWA
ncbi:MAG: hypothetical protein KR126chlam5_01039 [Candidatus Anoxychlamydiales bacterium]|nr:hypothetical protein [Candidatus Anoxychlamydiales bacterium]